MTNRETNPGIREMVVTRFENEQPSTTSDLVAVEEPLEIQITSFHSGTWLTSSIAVTMRTPGSDFELVAGFLFTEEVIQAPELIDSIANPQDENTSPTCNVVRVTLKQDVPFDVNRMSRHIFTSSSCGICGKQSIERIRSKNLQPSLPKTALAKNTLIQLTAQLEQAQEVFQGTGGLHASALFDATGKLLLVREDVGRHNALDKVVGNLFLSSHLPANDAILLLSGRASFELVQKAIAAGISKIVAIGPPSSLAVDLAQEFNVTLVGFLRSNRFNVYTNNVSVS